MTSTYKEHKLILHQVNTYHLHDNHDWCLPVYLTKRIFWQVVIFEEHYGTISDMKTIELYYVPVFIAQYSIERKVETIFAYFHCIEKIPPASSQLRPCRDRQWQCLSISQIKLFKLLICHETSANDSLKETAE
jgi:hypothetical protein